MGLGDEAERVRIGFVIHTTHGLHADILKLRAETHTLAVAADAGRKVAAATVHTEAVTTSKKEQNKNIG